MNDTQTRLDADHLRLLSIFHYVVGGLGFLASLFPTIWLVFGIAMLWGAAEQKPSEPSPELFGWLLMVFGGVFFLCGLAWSICMVLSGRFLAERQHYTFCLIMAAIACAFTPIGTVLGVFTIIVLSRQSVR